MYDAAQSAAATAARARAGQAWAGAKLDALVPAQPPADMPWPDNANAMGMFVPPAPGANAQQEEDLAADVLVALSGGHKSTAAAGGMPQEKVRGFPQF